MSDERAEIAWAAAGLATEDGMRAKIAELELDNAELLRERQAYLLETMAMRPVVDAAVAFQAQRDLLDQGKEIAPPRVWRVLNQAIADAIKAYLARK